MRRTRLLAIALWAPLAAGPPALGQQVQPASTTADATRAAADRARRLAEFVQAVRDADHPRQAITAYARGCAVDASRPEIHEAQMRRMLRFGLPKIALFPARSLVAIQPDNGLAWGVLGYVHGQRGELAEAFAASIRAAEHARDNPSILHNAGQLVAWYDHELELPKLPDRAKRSLSRIRDRTRKA